MKQLLVGLTVLFSINSFAGGEVQPERSKCVIEDYDNSISQKVKKILIKKGYSFSDSQSDSNLTLNLNKGCGQAPGYSECGVGIYGVIEGERVYTNSNWIESDVNPIQHLYRVGILNKLLNLHIRNLESCNTMIQRSSNLN